jgi:hypothetical protein
MYERMNDEMIRAVIEMLPVEITVIDLNDEVVGWNKHDTRIFYRPPTSMGLNFRECHPEESLPRVEAIVGEMKAGKRDKARFWINHTIRKGEKKHRILIEFYALRDSSGHYIGCMECTQDVEDIYSLRGEKRLLD